MGLELLSITLGLQTFKGMLKGRKVVIHSDNTGAEVRPHVVARAFALLLCVLLAGRFSARVCAQLRPRTARAQDVAACSG